MLTDGGRFATKRLVIRKPDFNDADEIFFAIASDPEVTRYLTWKPHETVIETLVFVSSCIRKWNVGDEFHWIIENEETGAIIGMIAVREQISTPPDVRFGAPWASIGYVIVKTEWNKGYATEALRGMIRHVFEQTSATCVITTCDIENLASARVMQKAGMEYRGIAHAMTLHPNISDKPRDVHKYSISRTAVIFDDRYGKKRDE